MSTLLNKVAVVIRELLKAMTMSLGFVALAMLASLLTTGNFAVDPTDACIIAGRVFPVASIFLVMKALKRLR